MVVRCAAQANRREWPANSFPIRCQQLINQPDEEAFPRNEVIDLPDRNQLFAHLNAKTRDKIQLRRRAEPLTLQ